MKSKTTHSKISMRGRGLGTVTEGMVRRRAQEIALTNGRLANEFNENDLDQARFELEGMKTQPPTEDETGERAPEWTELTGEGARQRTNKGAPDPQEITEQIVTEGADEALHEEMVEGNKASRKADQI